MSSEIIPCPPNELLKEWVDGLRAEDWRIDWDDRSNGCDHITFADHPLTICFMSVGLPEDEHDAQCHLIRAAPAMAREVLALRAELADWKSGKTRFSVPVDIEVKP